MPRFVVLTHDHPHWHWDFMLEVAGTLRTWRLDLEPGSTAHITATELPDHRLHYLEYEGPVSGNRGQVQRWDQGEYELIQQQADLWQVTLQGTRLQCQITLQRAHNHVWQWNVVRDDKRPMTKV